MLGESNWFVCDKRPRPKFRVFLFHHVGGNASLFRHWAALLPPTIEVVRVQLPGRASNWEESPHSSLETLIPAMVEQIWPWLDLPFAFFGYSMGAAVAYALSQQVQERGFVPEHLFVAAASAPREMAANVVDELSIQTDLGLEAHLRECGGTPDEVLNNPEMREMLFPVVRADYSLLRSLPMVPRRPLPFPITAFYSPNDPNANLASVSPWARETSAECHLQEFDGGHFFIYEHEQDLVERVVATLFPAAGSVRAADFPSF